MVNAKAGLKGNWYLVMSNGMSSDTKLMRGMATMRPTFIGKPVTMHASTNLLCKATMVKRVPLHNPIEVSKFRSNITGAWVLSVNWWGGMPITRAVSK